MKLLHVDSSPLNTNSVSRQLTARIVAQWQATHPGTVVTTLDAHYLLRALNGIEAAHGRVRAARWGDRTLDLDIIEFGGLMIASVDLTVPHPRAGERAFVLAPWLQLEPDATLPGLGRIDELLAATGETPVPYPAEPLL